MNSLNKVNSDLQKRLDTALSIENDQELCSFESEKIHLDLINEIAFFMKTKNYTKTDLAETLHTSKSYISQLFSGSKLLNLKTLGILQKKLGFKLKINLDFDGSNLNDEVVDNFNKEHFPNIQKLICPANSVDFSDIETEHHYPNNRILDEDYDISSEKYLDASSLKKEIWNYANKELQN